MLLRSAVFAMACDGEVHDDEVTSIRDMASDAAYFADLDAKPEVQAALDEIKEEGSQVLKDHLNELENLSLSLKQELLVYEVLLHVVHADDKIHSSEREFLQRVKEALGTEERTLIVNFPTYLDLLLRDKSAARSGFRTPRGISDFSFLDDFDFDNS